MGACQIEWHCISFQVQVLFVLVLPSITYVGLDSRFADVLRVSGLLALLHIAIHRCIDCILISQLKATNAGLDAGRDGCRC